MSSYAQGEASAVVASLQLQVPLQQPSVQPFLQDQITAIQNLALDLAPGVTAYIGASGNDITNADGQITSSTSSLTVNAMNYSRPNG